MGLKEYDGIILGDKSSSDEAGTSNDNKANEYKVYIPELMTSQNWSEGIWCWNEVANVFNIYDDPSNESHSTKKKIHHRYTPLIKGTQVVVVFREENNYESGAIIRVKASVVELPFDRDKRWQVVETTDNSWFFFDIDEEGKNGSQWHWRSDDADKHVKVCITDNMYQTSLAGGSFFKMKDNKIETYSPAANTTQSDADVTRKSGGTMFDNASGDITHKCGGDVKNIPGGGIINLSGAGSGPSGKLEKFADKEC